jgi:hypothetical protein
MLEAIKRRLTFADRFVLHDQSLPGRNRDAVLRDEEERDGEDAARARALPFDLDPCVVHEYLGAYYLLRRDRQVGTRLQFEDGEFVSVKRYVQDTCV